MGVFHVAITIDTYKITDAPNVVNKDLNTDTKITLNNVKPIEPCNLLTPSIVCDYTSNLSLQNYVFISAFGNRYYFITDVSVLSGNRCIINMSVDVLTTWSTGIKNSVGVCLRTETGPTYIPDNKYPLITTKRYIELDNYPDTPFSLNPSYPYVLTTIGGDTQ